MQQQQQHQYLKSQEHKEHILSGASLIITKWLWLLLLLVPLFFTVTFVLTFSSLSILVNSNKHNNDHSTSQNNYSIEEGDDVLVAVDTRYLRCGKSKCSRQGEIINTKLTANETTIMNAYPLANTRAADWIHDDEDDEGDDDHDKNIAFLDPHLRMTGDGLMFENVTTIHPDDSLSQQQQQVLYLSQQQPFVKYKPNTSFQCYYDMHLSKHRCYYGGHDYTTSLFQLVCATDTFIEPTSDICLCYLDVPKTTTMADSQQLGQNDNENQNGYSTINSYERCSSCSIAPSRNTNDGHWDISYDCSNIISEDVQQESVSSRMRTPSSPSLHHVKYMGNGNAHVKSYEIENDDGNDNNQVSQEEKVDRTTFKSTSESTSTSTKESNSAVVVVVNSGSSYRNGSNEQKQKRGIITTFVFTSSLDGGDGTIQTSGNDKKVTTNRNLNNAGITASTSSAVATSKGTTSSLYANIPKKIQRKLHEHDDDDDELSGRHGFDDESMLEAYNNARGSSKSMKISSSKTSTRSSEKFSSSSSAVVEEEISQPSLAPTELNGLNVAGTDTATTTNDEINVPDTTTTPIISPTLGPTSVPNTAAPIQAPPTTAPINPIPPPSNTPTHYPSTAPINSPSKTPTTASPSSIPTDTPTSSPTKSPIHSPTTTPTSTPTKNPSDGPTEYPIETPTSVPVKTSSLAPSNAPTKYPTISPTTLPFNYPSVSPSAFPTVAPASSPSNTPMAILASIVTVPPAAIVLSTSQPTVLQQIALIPGEDGTLPTMSPTITEQGHTHGLDPNLISSYLKVVLSSSTSTEPTTGPTTAPSRSPTPAPSRSPTSAPSRSPTSAPTYPPTSSPSTSPTDVPTPLPSMTPLSILPTAIANIVANESFPSTTHPTSIQYDALPDEDGISPTISPTTTEQGHTHGIDPNLIRGYLKVVSSLTSTVPPTEIANMGLVAFDDSSSAAAIQASTTPITTSSPTSSLTEVLYNIEMDDGSASSPTLAPTTVVQGHSHGIDPNMIRVYLNKVIEETVDDHNTIIP